MGKNSSNVKYTFWDLEPTKLFLFLNGIIESLTCTASDLMKKRRQHEDVSGSYKVNFKVKDRTGDYPELIFLYFSLCSTANDHNITNIFTTN